MAVILRGTVDPKLQRYSVQYSPVSGYNRQYDYKGFGESLMQSLMDTWTEIGCEATLSGEHDVYTLQVRDSTGETTLDSWQIQQLDERPNCLSNPRHISNTTQEEREIIRYWLDNPTENQSPAGLGAYALRLYYRMAEGATEFVRSIYILRHTTNAPSNYSANIADKNVDCIYTTEQLLQETQNSFSWRLPLPPAMAYFIDHVDFPDTRDYYINGWLKRGASRTTAANFRQEISTEYWMGQISTDEYASASDVY